MYCISQVQSFEVNIKSESSDTKQIVSYQMFTQYYTILDHLVLFVTIYLSRKWHVISTNMSAVLWYTYAYYISTLINGLDVFGGQNSATLSQYVTYLQLQFLVNIYALYFHCFIHISPYSQVSQNDKCFPSNEHHIVAHKENVMFISLC